MWHKVQCGGCPMCSPSKLTDAAFNSFDTIPTADVQTEVLIIGAGMAGISAAKELHTAGKQFIIIEGTDRVGGRIKKGSVGGSDIEQGANWIHGARARGGGANNPVWDLTAQLQLEGKFSKWVNTVTYDETGQVPDANVRWTPFENALACAQTKQLAMATQIGAASATPPAVDKPLRQTLRECGWTPTSDMDFAVEWFDVEYEFAVNSESTSTAASLINAYRAYLDEDFMIKDSRGYASIVSKLGEAFLGTGCSTANFAACANAVLKLNERVTQIEWPASGGVRVTVSANGVTKTYAAKYAISTLPVGVLQRSISRHNGAANAVSFVPELPNWKKDTIDSINMAHYCKIYLKFPTAFWNAAEFVLWADRIRGNFPVFQNLNLMQAGSNMLMVTVTGDRCEKASRDNDAKTIEDVMVVLRKMYGAGTPGPTSFYVSKWATDPMAYGSYSDYPTNSLSWTGRVLEQPVGNLFFSGEATEPNFFGNVHGAYYAGQHTAGLVLACMGTPYAFGYAGGPTTALKCPYATYNRTAIFDEHKSSAQLPIPNTATYSYTYDDFAWPQTGRRLNGDVTVEQGAATVESKKVPVRRSKKFRQHYSWEGWK